MKLLLPKLLLVSLASCAPEAPPVEQSALVGRWAVDGESCDGAWLSYRGDGSWGTDHNGGEWTLKGNRLTLRLLNWGQMQRGAVTKVEPALCHTELIEWRGADSAVTRWEDGTVHQLSRCDARKRPLISCLGDCSAVTPFDEHGWSERPPAATRECP